MSATGLEVFDKTVQTTNTWLKEIMEFTGPDRRRAYRVLAAVLHALRDRLTVDEVAQLGAQLPILVRGLYYDQWHHPSGKPERLRHKEEFLASVAAELDDIGPINPENATRGVLGPRASRRPPTRLKISRQLCRPSYATFGRNGVVAIQMTTEKRPEVESQRF
jgi:uncharacterized protein (DUF2267 family)